MNEPNFDSVTVSETILPYRDEPFLQASFTDAGLREYSAIMVEDSLAFNKPDSPDEADPNRLSTIIMRFPRPILAELNTHRVFSRNSASSRARSVKTTIAEVMNAPYVPFWTINKAGMSGEYASAKVSEEATRLHLLGRDKAVATALSFLVGERIFDGRTDTEIAQNYSNIIDSYYENVYDKSGGESTNGLSIHKQALNRCLEPYMYHEAIVTSSFWDNFLELRDHDDADPAIHAIARLTDEVLKKSEPETRWLHLPFIPLSDRPESTASFDEIKDLLFLSATESAQISYRDKTKQVKSTATLSLGQRLLDSGHLSPFEHCAIASAYYLPEPFISGGHFSGNLHSDWAQFRHIITSM